VCDRFAPAEEKIFKSSQESFKELLVVEGIDAAVRFFLLWLGPVLLRKPALGTALGSIAADISFVYAFGRSHRLVEIFSHIFGRSHLVIKKSGRMIQGSRKPLSNLSRLRSFWAHPLRTSGA